MHKSALYFLILLTYLTTSISFAQTLFGVEQPPKNNDTSQTGATPPPNKALSPNDFKSAVNSMSQQTQQGLAAQVNQLSKQPPAKTQSMMVESINPAPSSLPTPDQSPTGTPSTAAPTPQATPTTPPPAAVTPPPSSGTITAAPPEAPQQTQVYTGFGSGSSGTTGGSTTTTKDAGSSGSGWNIKY